MNRFIFFIFCLLSILTRGQNVTFNKDDIYLELLFIEEKTKDSLPISIVEIYSGGKRIDAGMSDYQGICFLVLEKECSIRQKKPI